MSPTPSVLFITTGLSQGGAEAALARLLAHPLFKAFHITVISLSDEGIWGEKLRSSGIQVETLRLKNSAVDFVRGCIELRRKAKSICPDLLQGWMYHGNLAATVLRTMIWPKRIPIVWGIRHALHDWSSEKKLTALIIRISACLSYVTNAVIFNSVTARKQHIDLGYCRSNSLTIPNGLDTSEFSPSPKLRREYRERLGISENAIVVGTLARFHRTKDFDTLFRAIQLVQLESGSHSKEIFFFLAGQNVSLTNSEFDALCEHVPDRAKLILPGPVTNPASVIPAFDIALLTSRSEAFPNFALEALSCGVPCVLTEVGDYSELIGGAGLTAPPGDFKQIAKNLIELITNPILRKELGFKGRIRAEERYSLTAIAEKYVSLYQKILQDKPS